MQKKTEMGFTKQLQEHVEKLPQRKFHLHLHRSRVPWHQKLKTGAIPFLPWVKRCTHTWKDSKPSATLDFTPSMEPNSHISWEILFIDSPKLNFMTIKKEHSHYTQSYCDSDPRLPSGLEFGLAFLFRFFCLFWCEHKEHTLPLNSADSRQWENAFRIPPKGQQKA